MNKVFISIGTNLKSNRQSRQIIYKHILIRFFQKKEVDDDEDEKDEESDEESEDKKENTEG